MDIRLRQADEKDIPFLLELRDKTMRAYLEEVGMATTVEVYENRIRYHFEHAQIVEFNGLSVGLFKVVYSKEFNYWNLVQIQILPEYQRMKLGSKLIEGLISQAKLTGAKVELSVIRTNPAKHLYSHLGFSVVEATGSEYRMQLQA